MWVRCFRVVLRNVITVVVKLILQISDVTRAACGVAVPSAHIFVASSSPEVPRSSSLAPGNVARRGQQCPMPSRSMHTIEMAHSRLGRDERYFGLAKSLRARGCRGDVDASQTDSSRRAHVLTFVGRLFVFDGLGRRQPDLQARQPETYTEDDNEAAQETSACPRLIWG